MFIPSPVATPGEFLDCIKSLEHPSAISSFTHCQHQLQSSPNCCFDDASALLWCDQINVLVVSNDASFNITNVMINN